MFHFEKSSMNDIFKVTENFFFALKQKLYFRILKKTILITRIIIYTYVKKAAYMYISPSTLSIKKNILET